MHLQTPMTNSSFSRRTVRSVLALGSILLLASAAFAQRTQPPAPAASVSIDQYIRNAWTTLQRSMSDCSSLVDPKVAESPVLYLPKDVPPPPQVTALRTKCGVTVLSLPVVIDHIGQPVPVSRPGLLYLPHPYVVPGGRFNEMYGWDSYFMILGLLRDGHLPLARGIVENFFFEIEHYGGILNANRTYYFTRSQPPFLSSMIREIYQAELAAGHRREAHAWLVRAYPYAVRDHALWMRPEQLAGDTGLARYYDYGAGPVPEMGDDPTYYHNVIAWLLAHPDLQTGYLVDGPAHPTPAESTRIASLSCNLVDSPVCYRAHIGTHWLTRAFYKGDRAMRESGFDTTFRFGPFGGSTDHFAPVGLNALLFKYERDLAWMAKQLGKPEDARKWQAEADARRQAINQWLWNPKLGMYFDYDFVGHKQSNYRYLTTFYPLWAGAASPEQARQVEANLSLFEKKGGLAMSTTDSGVQWDLPYGWAPVNWLAIDGMARYGDMKDASRTAAEFIRTVRDNFRCDHTIREKYNVVTGSSEFHVAAGYRQNVVGFGWTNAVYLKLEQLRRRAGLSPVPAEPSPITCTAQGPVAAPHSGSAP